MDQSKSKTYVGVVLDRSGSMNAVRQPTIDAFNRNIADIRRLASDQDVTVSLWTFGNNSRNDFFDADVRTLAPLTCERYFPCGSTALFDGVCDCIDAFAGTRDAGDANVAFLVIVITDGEENNSKDGNKGRIRRLMLEKQKTDRWTFAFLVPPGGYREKLIRDWKIPDDNVREWDRTEQGVAAAEEATSKGLRGYFLARAAGKTKVDRFYVETDLSGVTADDVRRKLVDVTDRFKVYEVPKEQRIDEFVSAKTRADYVVGSGFYQLMKTEIIQPHKEVVIIEKGKKVIYGGPAARQMIGLPDGADAKVTPGNHSNYDIFVQSKAPNRKLPRGTRLLVDKTRKKPSDPTWDYETARKEAEAKRNANAPAAIC